MCGVKLKDRVPSKELRERLGHTHTQPFYCSSEVCPGPPG